MSNKINEKIEIKVGTISTIDLYELQGNLDDVINFLELLNYKNPNYRLELVHNSGYEYHDFDVVGWRIETEEEYKARLESNKKKSEASKKSAENRRIANEKRERSLLETLKKKYE